MSTRKQRNKRTPSVSSQTTIKFMAKVILLALFYITLLLFVGLMLMGKAKAQSNVIPQKPQVETPAENNEKQAEYSHKVNKLIAKAISDKSAILVQCLHGKCHDTTSNLPVNVKGKDGYFLIYLDSDDTQREKIKQVAEDVKKLSSLVAQ